MGGIREEMTLVFKLIQEMKEEYLSKQQLYNLTNGDCVSYDYLRGMQKLLYVADNFVENYLEENCKCLTVEDLRDEEVENE